MFDPQLVKLFGDGILETLYMTLVSTAISYLLGLPIGVLLTTSAPDGISPRPVLYRTLDVVVNILRSVPFLILMVCVLGLTRFLVGTTIGSTAVIPPLVIAAAPYVGRMVEGSLKEVDHGVIEAAQSMGASVFQIITRVLLPFSILTGLLLVWQGVPQNFSGNIVVDTVEGARQIIATGPVAALESIKHLGTNGGGFLGANSSTPIENPTILTNLIELWSMMLLPGACVVTFGRMVHDRRTEPGTGSTVPQPVRQGLTARFFGKEGRSIFAAMGILFLIGLAVCFWAESQGNPLLSELGLSQSMGSMEGKEVRFGIAQSAMFTTVTTSFTTGTVNNMHDTLTPLGGMIPLLHMMLNVVFGGKGVGLMNMILYAILAVFICGLMIGRTPEYLGKKIEGREMKLTALCIIIHPLLILAFSALAVGTAAGREGITNPGFHGLSQVLYEYASSAANNGSGFEGLADNTCFWNITAGLAMFFGRYLSIVIQLAIAGSLMKKNFVNESAGTLRTDTVSFSVILVFVVYIFAALTFFPALALGPVVEHLALWG